MLVLSKVIKPWKESSQTIDRVRESLTFADFGIGEF